MSLFGVSKELQLGSATMMSHMFVPTQQREESSLKEGKRKGRGRAVGFTVNKKPIRGTESSKYSGFSLAECDSLSLAELLPGKKRRSFFFLLSSVMVVGGESSPFWPLGSILIEVSVY